MEVMKPKIKTKSELPMVIRLKNYEYRSSPRESAYSIIRIRGGEVGEGLKKGFPLKRGGGGASAYIGNLEKKNFFTSWKSFFIIKSAWLIFHAIRVNRVFSLTWPASTQIYWNKRKRLHKKRVSLFWDTNMAAVTSCENTLSVR